MIYRITMRKYRCIIVGIKGPTAKATPPSGTLGLRTSLMILEGCGSNLHVHLSYGLSSEWSVIRGWLSEDGGMGAV